MGNADLETLAKTVKGQLSKEDARVHEQREDHVRRCMHSANDKNIIECRIFKIKTERDVLKQQSTELGKSHWTKYLDEGTRKFLCQFVSDCICAGYLIP